MFSGRGAYCEHHMNAATFLLSLSLAGVAFFALVGIGFVVVALSPGQKKEKDGPPPGLRRAVLLTPRELGRAPLLLLGAALLGLAFCLLSICLTL